MPKTDSLAPLGEQEPRFGHTGAWGEHLLTLGWNSRETSFSPIHRIPGSTPGLCASSEH